MSSKQFHIEPAELNEAAKIIWDYHHMHHQLKKANCILVLGSSDLRVAEYAANLFLQGYAPYIVFSGKFGKTTRELFIKNEAETFADIAIKLGVPKDKILIEDKATNTGENIAFTKTLLAEKKLDPKTLILVQKPYMERRTYATFVKIWPEKNFFVTSPPITYEEYPFQDPSGHMFINQMVGDLQKIRVYPEMGFQIPQEIPENVWDAYEQLVAAGFNKRLIKET